MSDHDPRGHDHTHTHAGVPDDAVILNWFKFHPATPVTGPTHEAIRSAFRATARSLLEWLPAGPDRTLAMRKLQEAMMACNAAVANAQTEDTPQLNPNSTPDGVTHYSPALAAMVEVVYANETINNDLAQMTCPNCKAWVERQHLRGVPLP